MLFPTSICPPLLCESYAFTLSLADQGLFEFGKGAHDRQHEFAIGESSPVNVRLSFANSMRAPRLVRSCTRRRRSSRLRARRSMLCTTTVSPSRTNESSVRVVASVRSCRTPFGKDLIGPRFRVAAPGFDRKCSPGCSRCDGLARCLRKLKCQDGVYSLSEGLSISVNLCRLDPILTDLGFALTSG